MVSQKYQRLSSQDLQFLVLESPSVPMDTVSTLVYRNGPLMTADGGVDIEAYREYIGSILHRMPRYRQKLKWIPYADIPVWVDDRNFNIEYHIRHTALPRPGSREQLKNLTARILERPLDRERPLWELWLVEGLQDQRYAIISKIHHCMLGSLEGPSLSHVLMSENADQRLPEAPPFKPVKTPSEVSLLWDEWNRRYAQPIDALRNAGELLRRPRDGIGELEKRFGAVRNSLTSMIRRPPDTPVNGELSAHRRVEWLELPLQPLKAAHRKLDCSLNDVILGLLSGGVQGLFEQREFDLKRAEFKLAMPVYTGESSVDDGITNWIVSLPLDESDPVARIEAIARDTARLRGTARRPAMDSMIELASWVPSGLLSLFTTGKNACVNTLMTSIAGSQAPLYSMGAEMEAMYTHLPLMPGIGLGTSLMSYNDKLYWGFNGDYDLLPDLEAIKSAVEAGYADLLLQLEIDPGLGQSSPAVKRSKPGSPGPRSGKSRKGGARGAARRRDNKT